MRKGAIAAVVAALVVASLGVGYLSGNGTSATETITSVSTTTVTKTTTLGSLSSTSACSQLGSAPLFLLIANSSTGRRIGAVQVQVEKTMPIDPCDPTSTTSTNLGSIETNVNGSIEVCCTGSSFFFAFTYLDAHYQLNSTATATGEGAEIAQCVWFYVPSATSVTVFAAPFDPQC